MNAASIKAQIGEVERMLGRKVICEECGATFGTFPNLCRIWPKSLRPRAGETCGGYLAIEAAMEKATAKLAKRAAKVKP